MCDFGDGRPLGSFEIGAFCVGDWQQRDLLDIFGDAEQLLGRLFVRKM